MLFVFAPIFKTLVVYALMMDWLRRVALVNKRFHRLARCPALWRLQCESRRLAGLAPEPRKKAARTPSRVRFSACVFVY